MACQLVALHSIGVNKQLNQTPSYTYSFQEKSELRNRLLRGVNTCEAWHSNRKGTLALHV